ncbi:MAG: prefoldin subunit alpha [Thermoplasmata archaeon]|nr:MAG: prefoldin subunit alpha [Thermoplasmata archaeon]
MNEEELAQAIRTLEFYRTQLESFDQQYEFMTMSLREHTRAKETMEGYKAVSEGTETLIPIGAGSYLFTKAANPEKAVVGIGADVVIETNMDDAISKIDDRIKEIEGAMKALGEKYQEVANSAQELSAKIQSAYQR